MKDISKQMNNRLIQSYCQPYPPIGLTWPAKASSGYPRLCCHEEAIHRPDGSAPVDRSRFVFYFNIMIFRTELKSPEIIFTK
jgi:hypothetical protein